MKGYQKKKHKNKTYLAIYIPINAVFLFQSISKICSVMLPRMERKTPYLDASSYYKEIKTDDKCHQRRVAGWLVLWTQAASERGTTLIVFPPSGVCCAAGKPAAVARLNEDYFVSTTKTALSQHRPVRAQRNVRQREWLHTLHMVVALSPVAARVRRAGQGREDSRVAPSPSDAVLHRVRRRCRRSFPGLSAWHIFASNRKIGFPTHESGRLVQEPGFSCLFSMPHCPYTAVGPYWKGVPRFARRRLDQCGWGGGPFSSQRFLFWKRWAFDIGLLPFEHLRETTLSKFS